jgi:hypothetical protein
MPVILATQEAEIRRITVQGQPQANSLHDPILKKTHHYKRGGGVAQDTDPEFQHQSRDKKKEREWWNWRSSC